MPAESETVPGSYDPNKKFFSGRPEGIEGFPDEVIPAVGYCSSLLGISWQDTEVGGTKTDLIPITYSQLFHPDPNVIYQHPFRNLVNGHGYIDTLLRGRDKRFTLQKNGNNKYNWHVLPKDGSMPPPNFYEVFTLKNNFSQGKKQFDFETYKDDLGAFCRLMKMSGKTVYDSLLIDDSFEIPDEEYLNFRRYDSPSLRKMVKKDILYLRLGKEFKSPDKPGISISRTRLYMIWNGFVFEHNGEVKNYRYDDARNWEFFGTINPVEIASPEMSILQ